VQVLSPSNKHAVLCCPVCKGDLGLLGRALACDNGHSFDLSKSGYVNLTIGGGRLPSRGGDTRQQLERRHAFLTKGHFDLIADAIARQAIDVEGAAFARSFTALDAGCGTGYHLANVLRRIAAQHSLVLHGVGIDISKDAAHFGARHALLQTSAVMDIWSEWPLHPASVDLVISVFAPKNFREMARVLRPGGLLAMAYPGPDHLIELRRDFNLLGLRDEKSGTYAAQLAAHVNVPTRQKFRQRVAFDSEDVINLIAMGPNATRNIDARHENGPTKKVTTIDIEMLFSRKPRLGHR
jgi:23S rRNA (guanine745-N1)-methyltransferase